MITALLMQRPAAEIVVNIKNSFTVLLVTELKVQYLFKKKLEITAHVKPVALAKYLLM
jgi:hypothetical protein